ncbi:DNA cytosine methyltransferase [Endozoicomonas sp. ALB032]|uniref:DNA cytosine methyltransferase n=1 Tax=Endozoicomonas sp. ALB032 TaxID=3403082 RepID=UPI003BB6B385
MPNHIELFAGCGGMTLGLESAGFELVLANELSPMASETFAYNLLGENGENLRKLADKGEQAQKTFWLNSKYNRNELGLRLRENPRLPPAPGQGYNDLDNEDVSLLRGGLLIGDIIALNSYLKKHDQMLLEYIRRGFNNTSGVEPGVDLVSGGPPCQSFSLAGLRQHDNERNRLPWEFANFVELVQPRMVVLENVSGILHAFKVNGEKHYAWYEVAKAFVSKGFVPLCLHVNAKYVGAAQNRPRFIMLAMKESVFETFLHCEQKSGQPTSVEILQKTQNFYREVQAKPDLAITESEFTCCYDVEKNQVFFKETFLSPLFSHTSSQLHTVADAIEDLSFNAFNSQVKTIKNNVYLKEINGLLSGRKQPSEVFNHEVRRHSPIVKQRFSLYQALSRLSPRTRHDVISALRTDDFVHLTSESIDELLGDSVKVLGPDENLIKFNDRAELIKFLRRLKTKKQTQRALVKDEPAPAALSIPDDACHYEEFRSLTVREMARIQSFPDWFKFRSKITTGDQARRFEVPQYTQVGNAVPPLLGKAIGQIVNHVLESVDLESAHKDSPQIIQQRKLSANYTFKPCKTSRIL